MRSLNRANSSLRSLKTSSEKASWTRLMSKRLKGSRNRFKTSMKRAKKCRMRNWRDLKRSKELEKKLKRP
jgi:hypothetical protein